MGNKTINKHEAQPRHVHVQIKCQLGIRTVLAEQCLTLSTPSSLAKSTNLLDMFTVVSGS